MYTGNVALYTDGVKYRTFDSFDDPVLQDYFNTRGRIVTLLECGGSAYYIPVDPSYYHSSGTVVDDGYALTNIQPDFCVTYKTCVVAHEGQSEHPYSVCNWFDITFKDIEIYTRLSSPHSIMPASIQHPEYCVRIYDNSSGSGYNYGIGNIAANAWYAATSPLGLTLDSSHCYDLEIWTGNSYQCIVSMDWCLPPGYITCWGQHAWQEGETCEIASCAFATVRDDMWYS